MDAGRIFVATSDGLYLIVPGTHNSEPARLYTANQPLRGLTIVNRQQLWVSSGDAVLSLDIAELLTAGGSPTTKVVMPAPRAAGLALATRPRAGRLYYNETEEIDWGYEQATVQGGITFVSHSNDGTKGTNVFAFNATADGIWVPTAPVPDFTLQAQGDSFFLAAQLPRHRQQVFSYQNDGNPPTVLKVADVRASVFGSTGGALINYTFTSAIEFRSWIPLHLVMYSIPPYDRRAVRLAGVSLAPFNMTGGDQPQPTPHPVPSVTPSHTPLMSFSASPVSASPSPSFAYAAAEDFGVNTGSGYIGILQPDDKRRFFLMLRIGGQLNSSITGNSPDYRYLEEPRIAQPLFIDKFDRVLKRVVTSMPLPTRRNGPHAACTASFANWRMFPILKNGDDIRFVTVTCFDSLPGEIIGDSFSPPENWRPPSFAPNAVWRHPRRVIANIHAAGFVDTRTVLNDGCSTAIPVAAIRSKNNQRFKREYYYFISMPLPGAPKSAYNGSCGVRFVEHAANGTDGRDYPLVYPFLDQATYMHTMTGDFFVWDANPEVQQLQRLGDEGDFESITGVALGDPTPGSQYEGIYSLMARCSVAAKPLWLRGAAFFNVSESKVQGFIAVNPADVNGNFMGEVNIDSGIQVFNQVKGGIKTPDLRLALDACLDELTGTSVFMPRVGQPNRYSLSLTWAAVAVVTASTGVGAGAPANGRGTPGSALWNYKISDRTFTPMAALPCCESLWVSVVTDIFGEGMPSPSATPTSVNSASSTASATASRTPSASPSPHPFALYVEPFPLGDNTRTSDPWTSFCGEGGAAGAPCLSRALPPAPLFARVRGCPSGRASLQCASSHPLLAGLWREGPADVDCPSSGTAFAQLAPQLKAVPQPMSRLSSASTLPKTVSVACNFTSSRDSTGERLVAHSEVTFAYQPFQFPQWRELLLFFPKEGVVLSPTYGVSVSTTEHGAQLQGTTANSTVFAPAWAEYCIRSFGNASTGCLPESVVRSLVARLPSFADSVEGALGTGGPSRARKAFTATVSRAAYGILVSTASSPLVPLSPEMAAQNGLFTLATRISLGGYPATVLWVSADGTLLHFRFPQQLCASNASVASASGTSAGCGYQPLTITQPLPFAASHPSASAVNMSCPPVCPGFWRDDSSGQLRSEPVELAPTQPFVNSAYPLLVAAAASFPTASDVDAANGRLSSYPAVSELSTSTGLYFTFACPGFVDPSLGSSICANASHPLSSSCAFGDGASVACRTCPANSLCPGGARAQPLPRFWAASETSGVIIPCAPPSEARCLGWSASLNAVQCGADYDQSSYACLGCAKGRYPSETDSSCLPCDTSAPVLQILRRFFVIVGAILGIASLLFGCLWLLAKSLGSTLSGSASRFVDLLLFMVLLLQMLSEVAATATSGLPLNLKALYDFLASFNLKNVPIHQRCLEGIPPFLGDVLGYLFVLCANVVLLFSTRREWRTATTEAATSAVTSSSAVKMVTSAPSGAGYEKEGSKGVRRRSTRFYQSQAFGKVRRWLDVARARVASSLTSDTLMKALCIALVALYSRTCNAVFASLDCFEGQLTLQQVEGLDGRSTELVTSTAADSTSGGLTSPTPSFVTVNLLRSNPSFVCYSGSHRAAGVLAWFVLVTYLIGFPVWTLWLGARRRQASSPPSAPASGPASDSHGPVVAFFLHNTIRESTFFFRQIEMALLFILSLIAVLWKQASSEAGYAGRGSITCLLLLSLLGVMLWLKPYTAEEKWRLPVRACSFLLACLVAIINALQGSATLAQSPSSSLEQRVQDLGIVLIVAMVLYLLVLVYFVGSSMIQGARVEAAIRAIKAKASASTSNSRSWPKAATPAAAARAATVVTSPLHLVGTSNPLSAHSAGPTAPAGVSGGRIFVAPPSQVRSMVQGKTLGGDFQFSADDADGSVLGDRSAGQDGRIVVSSARGGEPALHRPNHPMHFQHLRADGEWSEFDEDSTAFRVANPIGQQAPSL